MYILCLDKIEGQSYNNSSLNKTVSKHKNKMITLTCHTIHTYTFNARMHTHTPHMCMMYTPHIKHHTHTHTDTYTQTHTHKHKTLYSNAWCMVCPHSIPPGRVVKVLHAPNRLLATAAGVNMFLPETQTL